MNKRNFGRVIAFIEKNPDLWDQGNSPYCADATCPVCFLGHAHRMFAPKTDAYLVCNNEPLAKRLGLTKREMKKIFDSGGLRLSTLKRWHKAGKVT